MYYDLHVPYTTQVAELQQTLVFLKELGYSVVALTHTLSGKLPSDLSCPIPEKLPFEVPAGLRIIRRCNLVLTDGAQNHRLQLISNNHDLLAIRPTNEKTLQQACQSLECDLISLDLTQRFETHYKMPMLSAAVKRGIKIEICYGPTVATADSNTRRTLISNATQLIRATRGRGLIISSEAQWATHIRGPADVINLAAVWGLGPEKGKEAVDKLARNLVVSAQLKRTSFRGVIDVVYGGEKPVTETNGDNKRKAEDAKVPKKDTAMLEPKISKREAKRRRLADTEAKKLDNQAKTIPT